MDKAKRPVAKARWRRFAGPVYRWLRGTLAMIGLLMLVYHAGFDMSQIVSPSMSPTLQGDSSMNGDWVLTEHVSYRFRTPRRWEVVALIDRDGNLVMKRVVGLPGERVGLVNGEIRINGQVVSRPAYLAGLKYYAFGRFHNGGEADCGEGYFVLGDDSRDSFDSRYEGAFESWRLRGRPWLIVGPSGRRGWVNR
jgi:signal peptidase I